MAIDSIEKRLPKKTNTKTYAKIGGKELQIDSFELPSGEKYDYYSFISHDQAVMVLAQTKDQKYVINQEFRAPVGKVLLSLPGGCVDPGEDPNDAASRELLEESGYRGNKLLFLGKAHPFAGHHKQETFYYLATNCHKIQNPTPETCEIFQTVILSQEEIEQKILKAENLDAHVLCALYLKKLKNL